jgi:hypothetical protein
MDELPLWSAPFGMMILDKLQYKKTYRYWILDLEPGFLYWK